jgi:hypothetical protein
MRILILLLVILLAVDTKCEPIEVMVSINNRRSVKAQIDLEKPSEGLEMNFKNGYVAKSISEDVLGKFSYGTTSSEPYANESIFFPLEYIELSRGSIFYNKKPGSVVS